VRTVGPAVVNISSEYVVNNRPNPFGGNPIFDNFFQDFFEPRPQKQTSLGSGVIIDGQRGFILTNAHVIEGAATINVRLQDERLFQVRIVGTDPDSDLAVLQIQSKEPLPAVAMGNSDDIMIGETIIAIGNPFGFSHTVTTGVVSAINRSIKTDEQRVFHEFLQTDASINPGNSGGPLLNINGELIGINTAIYAKAQGIGFAIPINKAQRIIADLIQYGHVVQAWIGLVVQDLDPRMAHYLNLQPAQGVVVSLVEEGSPAQKAGLEAGDVVLTMQRKKLVSVDDYASVARAIPAGETVRLSFQRKSAVKEIDIRSASFPEERVPQLAWRRLGVEIADLSTALRRRYRISAAQGVVLTRVRQDSYLARIGVAPGDVLLQMDDLAIATEKEFASAMIKSRLKSSLLLLVQRETQVYHLTVRLAP
jgi:Do/DeqQ family serine protease